MENSKSTETSKKRVRRNSEKSIENVRNTRAVKRNGEVKKTRSVKNSENSQNVKPRKSGGSGNSARTVKKSENVRKNNAVQNEASESNFKNKKKSKKKKQQWIILISVLVVVVVAICFLVSKFGKSDNFDREGYHEVKEDEDISNIQADVKISEDYVEPAEGTLDISKIQGYEVETLDSEGDDGKETSKEINVADPNLKIESVGKYSGSFIEDGSDEPVKNVAAMLITNNSDQMLQIAEVSFKVNDTENATFKVTNLPAGTSTLVLESNKREFKAEDSYTYGETATGYMEPLGMEEDKFELFTEDGKITLKNKTKQSYKKVYVYYKYVQLGGAYLGGITYRTPFENVAPGAEMEAIAAHFNPEGSQIMGIQILSE